MHAFETVIALLAAAAVLSILARRIRAPYPALLALGGAAAAFFPFAPELSIEPELVLVLFIAPVLLDAAFDASLRDLKANWLPISLLTLVAVGLTTVGVAWTVKQLVPGLPWAAAIALGAIVAPPDAAAATAVLRFVRPPRRVLTILEGESLFNDASALLVYRLAVGAVGAGALSAADVAGSLALATVASVALGLAAALAFHELTRRVTEAPVAILLQFCGTFGVWILAEALHASAIITVVVYGLTLGRTAARTVGAAVRTPAYAVWETAVFGLNALAFLLVGLQVGPIVENLTPARRLDYAGVAFAVLCAVIVVRLGWVMTYNSGVRLKNRWFGVSGAGRAAPPTWRTGLVVGWAGMRGTVSLATAYALPETFPQRDLLLVCAFAVVLGTLVLQGFTLGPLIRVLGVRDDGSLEAEIRLARLETARAGLEAIDGETAPEAEALRRQLLAKAEAAEGAEAGDGRAETGHHELSRRVIAAGRDRLSTLRADQTIGDEAYHQLEEELDRSELAITPVVR